MKRLFLALAFLAGLVHLAPAQTALSFSWTASDGSTATWWTMSSFAMTNPGGTAVCLSGWINKAAYTSGKYPVPGATHCYGQTAGYGSGGAFVMGSGNVGIASAYFQPLVSQTLALYAPTTYSLTALQTAAVSIAKANPDNGANGYSAWTANASQVAGSVIYDGLNLWQCTTAGTTGTTAPAWTDGTAGATVTDGTVVWTNIGVPTGWTYFFASATVTN